MDVKHLFEAEVTRRGWEFTLDPESGRHVINQSERQCLVSLDNLQREVDSQPQEAARQIVADFVDAVQEALANADVEVDPQSIYWILEDREMAVDGISIPFSDTLSAWLTQITEEGRTIFLNPGLVEKAGLSIEDAAGKAFENLASRLQEATLEREQLQGTTMGWINSEFPNAASLVIAPNFQEVVQPVLGWPVHMVMPSRDVVWAWNAEEEQFAQDIAPGVLNAYNSDSYPLSLEVFLADDEGILAFGAYKNEE